MYICIYIYTLIHIYIYIFTYTYIPTITSLKMFEAVKIGMSQNHEGSSAEVWDKKNIVPNQPQRR